MTQKPFPDFTSDRFMFTSPRSKLGALREFVLDHEGPVAEEDVRRLMAEMCKISIDLLTGSHMHSRSELDMYDATRLLRGELAMYERR